MTKQEKIQNLERILNGLDRVYDQLFDMGFKEMANTVLCLQELMDNECGNLELEIEEENV